MIHIKTGINTHVFSEPQMDRVITAARTNAKLKLRELGFDDNLDHYEVNFEIYCQVNITQKKGNKNVKSNDCNGIHRKWKNKINKKS